MRLPRRRRCGSVAAAVLQLLALALGGGSDALSQRAGASAQELQRLSEAVLPQLHSLRARFVVRELVATANGRLGPAETYNPAGSYDSSMQLSKEEKGPCILLDVHEIAAPSKSPASGFDTEALRRRSVFDSCSFRVLWARGRGGGWDWLPAQEKLCQLYGAVLVEDEFILEHFAERPPSCRILPVDPHWVAPTTLASLPWAPGEQLPPIDGPLVSFHAYTAYSEEAQRNPQRWLQDPDSWNPHFLALRQEGHLKLCLSAADCKDDSLPFRLMFWEDISSEFVECLVRGITPIFFVTSANYQYTERNIVIVPYRFQDQTEMLHWVRLLSSPQGVMEYGTKVYMQRQSNHILGSLYWRQDLGVRALLAASAAERMSARSAPSGAGGSVGGGSLLGSGSAAPQLIGELLVCVVSAGGNRVQRDFIRETWGSGRHVATPSGAVALRVLFFLVDDGQAARSEHRELGDVVLLRHMEDGFETIWMKTAAILKFGADYFQGRENAGPLATTASSASSGALRFLIKCDDDAFVDVDRVAADLMQGPSIGAYWGHIMALVEPNRVVGDKYFVPQEVYPMQYYPPYARGMAYALSEDLVTPLGDALFAGKIDPFPYREDVSVGLYLLELARRGEVKVSPRQRKDAMPLDFGEHCAARAAAADGTRPLLVLHRFRLADARCLWATVERRRAAAAASEADFCACLR